MKVRFPDGTVMKGLALRERKEQDPIATTASIWTPATLVDWEDFGLPATYESPQSKSGKPSGAPRAANESRWGARAGAAGRARSSPAWRSWRKSPLVRLLVELEPHAGRRGRRLSSRASSAA